MKTYLGNSVRSQSCKMRLFRVTFKLFFEWKFFAKPLTVQNANYSLFSWFLMYSTRRKICCDAPPAMPSQVKDFKNVSTKTRYVKKANGVLSTSKNIYKEGPFKRRHQWMEKIPFQALKFPIRLNLSFSRRNLSFDFDY